MAIKMLPETLLVPVFSHGKTLELLSRCDRHAHDQIIIRDNKSGIETIYQVPEEENRHGLDIGTIELSDIEAGVYSIWTQKSDLSERSMAFTYTMLGDKKRDLAQKAVTAMGEDTSDTAYRKVIESVTEKTDLPRILFSKYISAENQNVKKAAAKTLLSCIDLINQSTLLNLGLDKKSFVNMTGELKPLQYAERVIDLNVTDLDNQDATVWKQGDFDVGILSSWEEDTLHIIILVNKNEEYMCFLLAFFPSDAITSEVWHQNVEKKNAYKKAIDSYIDTPNSYLAFTEEERGLLSLINKLNPVQPLVKSPGLAIEDGIITVEIDEEDYELLASTGNNFLVNIKEPEFALDKSDVRPVKITGATSYGYAASIYLSDEPYLYWIEDQYGTIVSQVRYIDLRNYDFSMEAGDEEADLHFNEKVRKWDFYMYAKHMRPYINNKYESVYNQIDNAYKALEIDGETEIVSIVERIMERLCVKSNIANIPDTIRAILEDRTIYGNYKVEFLNSQVIYRFKENTVSMPPATDILYVFESYRPDEERKVEYIMSDAISATQYRFLNCDYGIVWCLDINEYKRSGFILFDMTRFKANVYNFLIDNIEVIGWQAG